MERLIRQLMTRGVDSAGAVQLIERASRMEPRAGASFLRDHGAEYTLAFKVVSAPGTATAAETGECGIREAGGLSVGWLALGLALIAAGAIATGLGPDSAIGGAGHYTFPDGLILVGIATVIRVLHRWLRT